MERGPGPYQIDIGCGTNKLEGYVGLDYVAAPGVDHVLDLTKDRFPFPDATVCNVFSAHFFEHIEEPSHVLSEIGRVCTSGAHIQIITPYAFSDEAFVYGHVSYLTELPWIHFCITHRDTHLAILNGRWLLRAINYVIPEAQADEIRANDFGISFAVKYFKGLIQEFIVDIDFTRELDHPAVQPIRTFSYTRFGERFAL